MTTPPLHVNEAELISFNGAAAGHDGPLTDASGEIFIKPCTSNERDFYQTATADHPEFAERVLPAFLGQIKLSTREQREALKHQDPTSITAALQAQEGTAEQLIASSAEHENGRPNGTATYGKKLDTELNIVLENVTDGFVKPNTLDVKLGARLWDDDARPEKKQRLDEVSMDSTSHDLGFRIAGMRVWQPAGHDHSPSTQSGFKTYDKYYGRKFKSDNVRKGFEDFFLDGPPYNRKLTALRRDVLNLCEAELQEMEQQLEKLETRIYSASILFVYEGDNNALDRAFAAIEDMQSKEESEETVKSGSNTEAEDEEDEDEDEDDMPKIHAVKLIDFAHAHWTPGQGRDENMLNGVRNVRRILRQMLDTSSMSMPEEA